MVIGTGLIAALALQAIAQKQQQDANNASLVQSQNQFAANAQRAQLQDQRQFELATAGRTDARGNKTKFIRGEGFVTTPTPLVKALLGAQDTEALKRNTIDAGIRRSTLQRGERLQKNAGKGAEAALNRARFRSVPSAKSVTADLIGGTTKAINQGFDKTERGVNTQLLRSGNTSNIGKLTADVAKQRGETLGNAVSNARAQGPQIAAGLEGSLRGGDAGIGAQLASLASTPLNLPISIGTSNPDTQLDRAASIAPFGNTGGAGVLNTGNKLAAALAQSRNVGSDSLINIVAALGRSKGADDLFSFGKRQLGNSSFSGINPFGGGIPSSVA